MPKGVVYGQRNLSKIDSKISLKTKGKLKHQLNLVKFVGGSQQGPHGFCLVF